MLQAIWSSSQPNILKRYNIQVLSVTFIKYYQLQLLGQSGTNVGESIKQTSPDFSQKTYMSKAWDWDVADTFAVLSLKRVLNHDFHWTDAHKFHREKQIVAQGPLTNEERVTERN